MHTLVPFFHGTPNPEICLEIGLAPLPWSTVLSSTMRATNLFQEQVIPNINLYFSDILDTFIFSAADQDNSEGSVLLRTSFPLYRLLSLHQNESCKVDGVKNLLETLRIDFQRSRDAVLRYARDLVNMKSVLLEMIRQASHGEITKLGRKRWKRIRSRIRSTLSEFVSDTRINIADASELMASKFSNSRLDRSKRLANPGEIRRLFL